jgi:hypothetical protein
MFQVAAITGPKPPGSHEMSTLFPLVDLAISQGIIVDLLSIVQGMSQLNQNADLNVQ